MLLSSYQLKLPIGPGPHRGVNLRLSLAMIVKDEAAVLGHCLESVRGLCDELVILDTGCRDASAAIARGHGARVEPFTWVDDFAAARNAALALCTGDWILVLDADEALDPADHDRVREAIASAQVQAYTLPIRNYLKSGAFVGMDGPAQGNDGRYREGSHCSHFYLQKAIRLFRAQPGPVYRGRVHEIAELYFEERGLPAGTLDVAIHHYGKLDMARDRAKQAEYFRLAQAEARLRPDDLQLQYNVIQEGLLVEAWEAVRDAAERFRRKAPRAPMLVWLGGGLALQNLGRFQESLVWFDNILAQRPEHAAALGARAASLKGLGRAGEAQAAYLQAIAAEPSYTLPFLRLSSLLEEAGDLGSARSVLEAGLDQNPKDVLLWEALVGLSARTRDGRVAADAWDALRAVPDGGQTLWHQIVVHALRKAGQDAEAAEVLARGLAAFPDHPELVALKGGRPS